jgi:hypothetical protein
VSPLRSCAWVIGCAEQQPQPAHPVLTCMYRRHAAREIVCWSHIQQGVIAISAHAPHLPPPHRCRASAPGSGLRCSCQSPARMALRPSRAARGFVSTLHLTMCAWFQSSAGLPTPVSIVLPCPEPLSGHPAAHHPMAGWYARLQRHANADSRCWVGVIQLQCIYNLLSLPRTQHPSGCKVG